MLKEILTGNHKSVMGINRRNLDYVYPNNPRKYFKLVDEKLTTKELLVKANVAFPKTLYEIHDFKDLLSFELEIKKYENFVLKPNKGRAGLGISIFGKRTEKGFMNIHDREIDLKQVRRLVSDILMGVHSFGMSDIAFIEDRIFPSDFLKKIYSVGLADLRIVFYEHEPLMGMLRIPTKISEGKANLHQGGIGVGFDLINGQTTHASFNGKSIQKHPDSNVDLLGLIVPEIKEILSMCKEVAKYLPLKYLGFDLTLDQNQGPLIIEINARPGLEIQNVNQKGLLETLR